MYLHQMLAPVLFSLNLDDIPGAILKKGGGLPLFVHLASSFDVINKGHNFGTRIFEIVYRVFTIVAFTFGNKVHISVLK